MLWRITGEINAYIRLYLYLQDLEINMQRKRSVTPETVTNLKWKLRDHELDKKLVKVKVKLMQEWVLQVALSPLNVTSLSENYCETESCLYIGVCAENNAHGNGDVPSCTL